VTKDGREGVNKSYMFVYRTSELSEGKPVVLYQYGKTRSKSNIQRQGIYAVITAPAGRFAVGIGADCPFEVAAVNKIGSHEYGEAD